MDGLLRLVGWVVLVIGFIVGIMGLANNFGLLFLLASFIGGVIWAVLFFGLASIVEEIEENRFYLREVLKRLPGDAKSPRTNARPVSGRTKARIENLKDYKMKPMD